MNIFKTAVMAAMATAFAFAGCKKDDPTTTVPPVINIGTVNMKATVGNTSGIDFGASAVFSTGKTVITAKAADGKIITITVNGAAKGSYVTGDNSKSILTYQENANGKVYSSANADFFSGAVIISEIDETNKTITGSFNGSVSTSSSEKTQISGDFTKVPYTGTPITFDNSITAKIDGMSWTASNTSGATMNGKLAINGMKSTTTSIGFFLPTNVQPGTYDLTAFGDYVGQYMVNSTMQMTTSGQITITEHDATAKIIKGTFHFDTTDDQGNNPHSITDGVIEMQY